MRKKRWRRLVRWLALAPVLWVGCGLGQAWYVEHRAWSWYGDLGPYQQQQYRCRGDLRPDIRVDYWSAALLPLRSWKADFYKNGQRVMAVSYNPIFYVYGLFRPAPENMFQAIGRYPRDQTLAHLLRRGADPDTVWTLSPGDKPSTLNPLTKAVTGGRLEAIRLLLRHGADLEAPTFEVGSPLRPIQKAARYGVRGSFMALLDAGASLSGVDPAGASLLHDAARHCWADVIDTLLAAGLAVNAADSTGATPLLHATRAGGLATARALLDAGADPNATCGLFGFDDFSVLHAAVYEALLLVPYFEGPVCPVPRLEIIDTLLRAGADVRTEAQAIFSRDGVAPPRSYTPLQLATELRPDHLPEADYRAIVDLLRARTPDAGAL